MIFIGLAFIVLNSVTAAFCLDNGRTRFAFYNWIAVLANTFALFSYIPKSVF